MPNPAVAPAPAGPSHPAGPSRPAGPARSGLRDRKRIATRERLAEAAAFLALRDGIEQATVEAISDRAGVSARTFFNYFAGKEDAILGLREIELPPETLAHHLRRHDGADALDSIVGLLFTMIDPSLHDEAARLRRMELLRRFPHLVGRQLAQLNDIASTMSDAVRTILRGDPAWSDAALDDGAADLVLSLCLSSARIAITAQATEGCTADADDLERRTIRLLRSTVGRLSGSRW